MELLHVELEVQERETLETLAEQLSELGVPGEYVLQVEGREDGSSTVSVYLKPGQRDRLADAGFTSRVVLDLSTIKDPREYVSRGNRFADELERLRARRRED